MAQQFFFLNPMKVEKFRLTKVKVFQNSSIVKIIVRLTEPNNFNCCVYDCHAEATSNFDEKIWTKAIEIMTDHNCESCKVPDAALRTFFSVCKKDELPEISKTIEKMSKKDAKILKEAYEFGSLHIMNIRNIKYWTFSNFV
jgi:hypothetical protein